MVSPDNILTSIILPSMCKILIMQNRMFVSFEIVELQNIVFRFIAFTAFLSDEPPTWSRPK